MPEIPANLGKYQVLGKIARGGMAEVYQAKAVGIAGFERILAVKRILPKLAQEPRFIRSFIDEARIAVSLNHRNIVQVVDFGKSEGELFLAMELIDGVDLRTALKKARELELRLPPDVALHILADVASGLDYAHRKSDDSGQNLGIVHCDISPQNIMLSVDGFVKILDFGVARAGFVLPPEERRLRGKPRYMAPEQTRGDTPIPATDIFALGIVAWELLTGLRLFDGTELKAILKEVRHTPSPPVISINPEVPEVVSEAIARALSKKPGERGSAADLATVFARCARDAATTTMDQALARWIRALFPRPELESTQITRHPGADAPEAAAAPVELEEITEMQTAPPALAPPSSALLERRQVVVVAAFIDGGSVADQADLRRSLGLLAFKRGALMGESGDVTAIFGLQVAGEDDVAAAMHFALDAIDLARETAAAGGAPLGVRIAALAGVIARREASGYRLEDDAEARAQRLAMRADPGKPLLAGGTGRRATARFAFRERRAERIRERRVPVFELVGPTDFDARARVLHDRRGRFFGRRAELETLDRVLDQVEMDHALRCVGIVGEAGVGKSRLIAEFVARAAARRTTPGLPPLSVAVAATPEAADAPFSLVGDVLQAALNLLPLRGEAARSQLSQRLRLALVSAGLAEAELASMVDTIDAALALRDGARLSDVTPPARLLERMTAIMRRLRAVPAGLPRLLILEDYQHADPATRAILEGVLAPPIRPGAADLVVVSARSASQLPRDYVAEIIELYELDDDDAEALVRDRFGEADEQAVLDILDRAGGNPLFIEELAESSREGTQSGSVRDVIRARIDRLPPKAKTALQYAAVAGPIFRSRLIDEIAPVDVSGAVDELLEAGLIEPADPLGSFGGAGEYQFRHGLIRDVVYDSLTDEAVRETHSHLGQLLATRYAAGRDEPPSVVAKHLALGGHRRLAGDYWRAAGAAALGASFAQSAADAYTRALELYRETEESPSGEVAESLLGRARALLLLGDHGAAARALAEVEGFSLPPAGRARRGRLRAELALRQGAFDAARQAADDAEEAARAAGDMASAGDAMRLRAEAYERLGNYDRATEAATAALQLFEGAGQPGKITQGQLALGRIHLMRARYREAQAAYGPLLQHLEQWSDPWALRLVQNHVAVIELCMGNFERAWAAAQASLAICERYGDRARAGDNYSVSGLILSEVGQWNEADECFSRALAIQGVTDSRWAQADCLVYAGLNDHRSGRTTQGKARIEEALKLARSIGARYIEANALCGLTELLLGTDAVVDLGRALDAAVAATEIARETGLISAEILAQSRLAQATAQTGDIEQAMAQSARAIDLLEVQEFIEGAEEEVFFADYQMRRRGGQRTQARGSLERALAAVGRKLESLRPAWRRGYRGLPRTAAILASSTREQL